MQPQQRHSVCVYVFHFFIWPPFLLLFSSSVLAPTLQTLTQKVVQSKHTGVVEWSAEDWTPNTILLPIRKGLNQSNWRVNQDCSANNQLRSCRIEKTPSTWTAARESIFPNNTPLSTTSRCLVLEKLPMSFNSFWILTTEPPLLASHVQSARPTDIQVTSETGEAVAVATHRPDRIDFDQGIAILIRLAPFIFLLLLVSVAPDSLLHTCRMLSDVLTCLVVLAGFYGDELWVSRSPSKVDLGSTILYVNSLFSSKRNLDGRLLCFSFIDSRECVQPNWWI